MTEANEALAPFRRFRSTVVRLSLTLTALCAAIAYPFNPIVTQGILLGGLGGLLGFWMMARRLEKLASIPASKVKFAVLAWSFYRFAIYAAILIKAYTLDRESLSGMWAAVAGILLVRVVLMFLGFTGVDLGGAKASVEEPEDMDP